MNEITYTILFMVVITFTLITTYILLQHNTAKHQLSKDIVNRFQPKSDNRFSETELLNFYKNKHRKDNP